MKNLKLFNWLFILFFIPIQFLSAQVDSPADVRAVLSDDAIAAANENIVKCFSQIAEGEVVITSINNNAILIKDDKELLINEQVMAEEFIKAIDLPAGLYILIITAGEKKVTREVWKKEVQ